MKLATMTYDERSWPPNRPRPPRFDPHFFRSRISHFASHAELRGLLPRRSGELADVRVLLNAHAVGLVTDPRSPRLDRVEVRSLSGRTATVRAPRSCLLRGDRDGPPAAGVRRRGPARRGERPRPGRPVFSGAHPGPGRRDRSGRPQAAAGHAPPFDYRGTRYNPQYVRRRGTPARASGSSTSSAPLLRDHRGFGRGLRQAPGPPRVGDGPRRRSPCPPETWRSGPTRSPWPRRSTPFTAPRCTSAGDALSRHPVRAAAEPRQPRVSGRRARCAGDAADRPGLAADGAGPPEHRRLVEAVRRRVPPPRPGHGGSPSLHPAGRPVQDGRDLLRLQPPHRHHPDARRPDPGGRRPRLPGPRGGEPSIGSSSVFPTGGASNPTLTIIALCFRIADRLKRELAADRCPRRPIRCLIGRDTAMIPTVTLRDGPDDHGDRLRLQRAAGPEVAARGAGPPGRGLRRGGPPLRRGAGLFLGRRRGASGRVPRRAAVARVTVTTKFGLQPPGGGAGCAGPSRSPGADAALAPAPPGARCAGRSANPVGASRDQARQLRDRPPRAEDRPRRAPPAPRGLGTRTVRPSCGPISTRKSLAGRIAPSASAPRFDPAPIAATGPIRPRPPVREQRLSAEPRGAGLAPSSFTITAGPSAAG